MASTPLLVAEGIQLRYRNGALGVVDVSLQVEAGQVVAILGPNGAGKTSTVRAMSGFLPTEGARITKGRVVIDGHDLTQSAPHRYASHGIAFIPERQKIFPNMSVLENMRALGSLPRGHERSVLEREIFDLFPELATRRRDYAGRLSGGQRQMLALARGFMLRPKVLIVDEMSLGLHYSLQPRLFEAVKGLVRTGASVILVDESVGLNLDIADYCYLIGAGCVRAQGSPAAIRKGDAIANVYLDAI
jgi:branched-chain amino acid transport system ATP-binding protein